MPQRLIRTLVCLVLALVAATPSLAADPAKKPEDFRGIRWGAAPASLPGLNAVDRDGDIVHYDRPGEKKTLGAIPLRTVTYSFYKDQFYHAEIDYEGQDAAEAVQRSLEEKYGPPDAVRQKTDTSGKAYEVATWNWPGFAFIGNRHETGSPRGRIFYFYAPLTDVSAKAQGLGPAQPKAGAGYTVKKGDSLSRIAKQLGVTEADLVRANPGVTDKSLKSGAVLSVPGQASSQAAPRTPDKTAAPSPERAPAPLAKRTSPAAKAPAAPGGFVEYKVKDGDVLSKVANAHGARTKDVVAANPGINPDALRPGTILKIPAGKTAATPASSAPPEAAAPSPAAP